MKKKLLLTGASGLLGSWAQHYLDLQGNYDLVTHSRNSSTDFSGDLTDESFTSKMISEIDPDMLINLVALTNVDQCEKEPNQAYLINGKTVENLTHALSKTGKCDFIQISTDQVYDDRAEYNGEENIKLTNYYAYSKYMGELFAKQYPRHIILRTNFFGPSKTKGRQSLSDWIIKSCQEKTTMTLFTDVIFSPLHIETLLTIINKILENPHYGTFNLGSHDGLSKKEFARELAKHLNLNIDHASDGKVQDLELKAYRPKDMRMDLNHFEKTYDFKLPTLLEEIRKLS